MQPHAREQAHAWLQLHAREQVHASVQAKACRACTGSLACFLARKQSAWLCSAAQDSRAKHANIFGDCCGSLQRAAFFMPLHGSAFPVTLLTQSLFQWLPCSTAFLQSVLSLDMSQVHLLHRKGTQYIPRAHDAYAWGTQYPLGYSIQCIPQARNVPRALTDASQVH
eukprot:1023222-Pelagomonas_calceolata.AAC.1